MATASGQLWRIGEHRFLCGDSTQATDVERLMKGERAALFATDPPYAVGYTAVHIRKVGVIAGPLSGIKTGPGSTSKAKRGHPG